MVASNLVTMVNHRWVPVTTTVLALATLATPALAHGSTAPDSTTTPTIFQQIWVQPVLPTKRTLDADRVQDAVDLVGAWAQSTSAGRWRITTGGTRPTIDVSGRDCSSLIREVALDRQVEHKGDAVTVYVGDARDCPYLGQAETPGSWVMLANLRARDDAMARTLAHELGHTLGLLHAGAETCAVLTASPRERSGDCGLSEYGDYTDPMGRGSLDWSLGPIARASLGWSQIPEVVGDGSHEIRLGAEEAIRITDPVTATTYVVAHRRPGPGADQRSAGVHLYRLPQAGESDVSSVHVPWVATPSRPWGGRSGMAFLSPGGAVAVEVRSASATSSEVMVTIDSQAAIPDTWGPVFAEGTPHITWRKKSAIVRVPRAFDQSGVERYVVRIDGRVIASHRMGAGIDTWHVRLAPSQARNRHVSVQAVDAVGNTTRIALHTRRSPR